jgi:hypothetical protein
MNKNRGIDSGNWHYQFVEGILYITSKTQPGRQVALTANEASDLLDYLSLHKEELDQATQRDLEQSIDPQMMIRK